MPSAGDSTFGAVEPVRMSTFLSQVQPGQWQVSHLDGLEVYNSNNEKIGDISELVLDAGGKVQAVVIGVGGILGVGAREVAFPFEQIRFVNEPRAGTTGEASLSGTSPGGGTVPSPAAAGTAAAPPVNPNMATNNPDAGSSSAPGGNGGSKPDQQTASTGRRAVPNHAVLMVPMTKEQLQEMPEFQQP
jgi:sporulation protein YlmC with PRC-barrel domain